MNEIEYAITNLEEFLEADIGQGDLHICSAEIALASLREQAERERGCGWCKVGQDNARTVWIDGSFDAFTGDSYGEGASHKGIIDRKVAYCPMCGRRLEAEHDL